MTSTPPAPDSLEAKLVVLGSQGVGKTSLVQRFVKNTFSTQPQSTVGAAFMTTRVHDAESGTTIRLQIWDTAGQERYRSISRLYYRGAHAAILCYDVTSDRSFDELRVWLAELREFGSRDTIIHFVGTKTDVVAADPEKRQVPFERCMDFVAEQPFSPEAWTSEAVRQQTGAGVPMVQTPGGLPLMTPCNTRATGFWGPSNIWDCHEVSAKDGEGIEEVFRVITRKLVEQEQQHEKRIEQERAMKMPDGKGRTPGIDYDAVQSYFDLPRKRGGGSTGSFRLGMGDKRKSWMGFPTPGGLSGISAEESELNAEVARVVQAKGRCC